MEAAVVWSTCARGTTVIRYDSQARPSQSLDELDALSVVFRLAFSVICERPVFIRTAEDLEVRGVRRYRAVPPAEVLDPYSMRLLRSVTLLAGAPVCVSVDPRSGIIRSGEKTVSSAETVLSEESISDPTV